MPKGLHRVFSPAVNVRELPENSRLPPIFGVYHYTSQTELFVLQQPTSSLQIYCLLSTRLIYPCYN